MDFKFLSAKAKEFGVRIHIFNKKLFSNIANNMADDENILLMIKGHDIKTSYKYPVVITDKKVYISKYKSLYGALRTWVIPMENITNIFRGRVIFFYTVVISFNGDAALISRLSKKKADKIINLINDLRGKR